MTPLPLVGCEGRAIRGRAERDDTHFALIERRDERAVPTHLDLTPLSGTPGSDEGGLFGDAEPVDRPVAGVRPQELLSQATRFE